MKWLGQLLHNACLPSAWIGPILWPHILRWHLIPKNRYFNIWLHKIVRDDMSRNLHTHPSWNISIPLVGWYIETVPLYPEDWPVPPLTKLLAVYLFRFRRASEPHRISLPAIPKPWGWEKIPCWSLFICGNPYKPWGFWVNGQMINWRQVAVKEGRGHGG